MKVPHYRVLVADPAAPDDLDRAAEHEVYIMNGDQLRAELEGPRNGIPSADKAPLHGVTLWIWAALMRTHVIDEPFQVFSARLLQFEDMDNAQAAGPMPGDGPSPADPIQPAAVTGSPSSSLVSSGTSAGGSTPTAIPGS